MARPVEKEESINLEIMLSIKNEFPKLKLFYKYAGLNMTTADFYAVMRGENAQSEHVREVELGYNRATKVQAMSVADLVKMAKCVTKQMVTPEVEEALRVIAGRIT